MTHPAPKVMLFNYHNYTSTANTRHAIQCLYKASPAHLLKLIRQYLGIESGLYYRRDGTVHEDDTHLSVGSVRQTLTYLVSGAIVVAGVGVAKSQTRIPRHVIIKNNHFGQNKCTINLSPTQRLKII